MTQPSAAAQSTASSNMPARRPASGQPTTAAGTPAAPTSQKPQAAGSANTPAATDDEASWGLERRKSRFSKETKLGLAFMLVLMLTFGFVLYKKMERHAAIRAESMADANNPVPTAPPGPVDLGAPGGTAMSSPPPQVEQFEPPANSDAFPPTGEPPQPPPGNTFARNDFPPTDNRGRDEQFVNRSPAGSTFESPPPTGSADPFATAGTTSSSGNANADNAATGAPWGAGTTTDNNSFAATTPPPANTGADSPFGPGDDFSNNTGSVAVTTPPASSSPFPSSDPFPPTSPDPAASTNDNTGIAAASPFPPATAPPAEFEPPENIGTVTPVGREVVTVSPFDVPLSPEGTAEPSASGTPSAGDTFDPQAGTPTNNGAAIGPGSDGGLFDAPVAVGGSPTDAAPADGSTAGSFSLNTPANNAGTVDDNSLALGPGPGDDPPFPPPTNTGSPFDPTPPAAVPPANTPAATAGNNPFGPGVPVGAGNTAAPAAPPQNFAQPVSQQNPLDFPPATPSGNGSNNGSPVPPTGQTVTANPVPTGAGSTANNTAPRGQADVYTVQHNDSYWTISKRVYGSARYFQALARYNAHRIPEPKKMRPGMKVLVPPRSVLEQSNPDLFPKHVAGKITKDNPAGFYQNADGTPMFRVGSDDTLGSIAQQHLGRFSRWIEIYQLNQQQLPNANKLQIGTELRLPRDASRVRLSQSR